MKKITLFIAATTLSLFSMAQSFTAVYPFTSVTATSGTTDPTVVPTAPGATFGSFTYVGAQINPNAAGRFSFVGWSIGALNADDNYANYSGSLDPANYYQVIITPTAGNTLSLTQINFDMRRSATGPRTYAIRSSADGFAANLPASISPANPNLTVQTGNVFLWAFDATVNTANQLGSTITLSGAPYTNATSAITFRIYAWNAEATTGSFGVDNVTFTGSTAVAPLAANFTANNVCFADSVHFTDMSTGPNTIVSWTWDFGDASLPGNATNPVHYYAAAGTYPVTLTVVDNLAGTDSYTGSVTVHSKPVSDFTAPASACGSFPVQLFDASTVTNSTITSLNYDFGDVASGTNNTSTLTDPIHVFNTPGTYTLTQIATSAFGCKDTSSATINIYDVPVAAFTSAGSACNGTSVQFTDASSIASGSISNYDWDFADVASGVNNTSTLQDPTHTFSAAGSFIVTQIVTSTFGCKDTVTNLFIVNPNVVPSVSISGSTSVCEGDSIVGIANGVNVGANPSYVWYVAGFGPVGTDSVLVIPAGTTTAGTYTVTVELTSDATCASITTVTSSPVVLTVKPIPSTPVISATGSTLSTTTSYSTYQWFYTTTTLGTASTETASLDGDYTVVVSDGNGCYVESDPYTYLAIGINSYSSNNNVTVFPNPSSNGVFNYTIADVKAIVTVYNIVGKQISNTEVLKGTHTIDLSNEANGSYFLSIKTDKAVITKKLIVNK